jgi:hypothetical protein
VIAEIESNHRNLVHKIETEPNIEEIKVVEGSGNVASSDREHFKESPLIGKNEKWIRFVV